LPVLPTDVSKWPRVEIVTSYAGASDSLVRALRATGIDGIVVAGTGNGSVHRALLAALLEAQAAGVSVSRCSRCLNGSVIDDMDAGTSPSNTLRSAAALTPVQARVELMLRLMSRADRATGG
jgi:L-asparaginase